MGNFSELDFRQSVSINNATFQDYWARLKILATILFKWENLPSQISHRFLEETLYQQGRAGFAFSETYGFVALPVMPSGTLNIYHEAVEYTLYSIGFHEQFARNDMVLIRNNYLERPTDLSIQLFAYRLYQRERATDVNIAMQKFPGIILTDEKRRFTYQNIMAKYDGNTPLMIGDKNVLDLEAFRHVDFGVPFVADKLTKEKHEVWNECMSFLGIKNANTDKRERLITDEVNANNEMIDFSSVSMLAARQEAAKQINARFNLDISVRRREYDEISEAIGGIADVSE